jgi:MoxR-like ATPase
MNPDSAAPVLKSIDEVQQALEKENYICDRRLAITIYLALNMGKPLLLEGEAGVGKTEVAKVLAPALGRRLIRLQCYEGLDASTAIYDWNYTKQILSIKLAESRQQPLDRLNNIFSEEYLIQRPLLEAIRSETEGRPVVLLVDELDRADEEFEAFLLEVLSDFQITIPEIGTLAARSKPVVVITSNRTRELHDAIKRRCLYHWIPYPALDKEYAIVLTKVPEINRDLARKICALMQEIRGIDFFKRPGIAETLDWVRAMLLLNRDHLDEQALEETLGCLFKVQEDLERVEAEKLIARWAAPRPAGEGKE